MLGWARLELYWGKDGRRGQGGDLLCTFLDSKKGKRERVGKKEYSIEVMVYIYSKSVDVLLESTLHVVAKLETFCVL